MKAKLSILTAALAVSAAGSNVYAEVTAVDPYHTESVQRLLEPVEYPNTKTVVATPDFRSNWFVGVQGGVSALVSRPISCGDLYDKSRLSLAVNAGKWFTPTIGGRVTVSRFEFTNSTKKTMTGWGATGECLWNITNAICGPSNTRRFAFSTFAGMGVAHKYKSGQYPFALSYGAQFKFGLTSRLKLDIEFGAKTTSSRFDGIGSRKRFRYDHVGTAMAGLSLVLGKNGFETMPDVKPVVYDNSKLRELCSQLIDEQDQLKRDAERNNYVIGELKKIMTIEGLVKHYGKLFDEAENNGQNVQRFPINDYSGLNKLRARLKGLGNDMLAPAGDRMDPEVEELLRSLEATDGADSTAVDANSAVDFNSPDYIKKMRAGEVCIGSPVFVFFKFGTPYMSEPSQVVNIDEIARLVKDHNLTIKVTGAADSFTGGQQVNTKLGEKRAETIINLFKLRGVKADKLVKVNAGGIDTYKPNAANRHTKIELFF